MCKSYRHTKNVPERLKTDIHIKRKREHLFGKGTVPFQEHGTQSRKVH